MMLENEKSLECTLNFQDLSLFFN